MQKYELMVILDPGIGTGDEKKQDAVIAKLIGEYKQYIKETVRMGKRRLAYEIKKFHEGVYCLVKLEAPHINVMQMNQQAKLMPELIRFMLVKV